MMKIIWIRRSSDTDSEYITFNGVMLLKSVQYLKI